MAEIKGFLGLRYVISLSLIATLLLTFSMVSLAAPGALAGEIIVSDQSFSSSHSVVTLNGEPALSGRTFLSSGVISTSAAGSATINLGKLGSVSLSPASTLSLVLSENNISGELSAGQAHVFNNEGVSVSIKTPDNMVTGNSAQQGNFTIDLTSGSTEVAAEAGDVSTANGEPVPAAKRKKRGAAFWWLVGIGAGVGTGLIIWAVTNDDEITSPVR